MSNSSIYKQVIVEPKKNRPAPPRLFARAIVMGFRRSKRDQTLGCNLLKIQGVTSKDDATFYLGKRVAYVYKAPKADIHGKRHRAMWGRIRRLHGSNGTVRACFKKNLPASAIGKEARIFLFPSAI